MKKLWIALIVLAAGCSDSMQVENVRANHETSLLEKGYEQQVVKLCETHPPTVGTVGPDRVSCRETLVWRKKP